MTRPFRFAVQVMEVGDRKALVEAARQAEGLGYEELYSYDHLGAVDPFLPLLVAAEATTSLRFGPLVLNNEFHHPGLLARTAATFDLLTAGRLILGVGTGYARPEHEALGIEYRPPGARVDRLRESLLAIRSLLDQGSVNTSGRYHQLDIGSLGVRPAQAHVPVLVGGHGRRVIGVAAELADIFQFTGMVHGPDGTPRAEGFAIEAVGERARWLAEAAGRRDPEIERSVLVQRCVVGSQVGAAIDRAAEAVGVSREVVESSPFLLMGTVSEIVERLEALRESLGVSHIVVREAADFAPVVAALAGR